MQPRNMFRRITALALAFTMLLSAGLAASDDLSYPFTTVTTDNVNMRRSASSSSVVLERIDKGDSITVLGTSGNYYKVSYNDRTGYVLKQYVDVSAATTPLPTVAVVEKATGYPYETTTKDSVNLREKKSTSSGLIRQIPQGATITILAVSGDYAQVEYKGDTGYCVKDYINIKEIVKATNTPAPTAVPVETSDIYVAPSYTIVQKGDTGTAVRALQSALIELGFLSGEVDGKFGSGTENALKAFQETNEYPVTGMADANLQAFLYEGKPKNSQGKATEVMTLSPLPGAIIRLNNMGDAVVTVQTRLKELGYYDGEITGTYDKDTQSAVKAFQKANDLTADGAVGTETKNKLNSVDVLPSGVTASPTPSPTPTPAPTYTIPESTVRSGSSGDDAKLVQSRLKELGYYTGKVDGKFGSGSVKALEAFQETNGLEADGIAGKDTYNVLFSVTALKEGTTPTPTPSPTPKPTPTPAPTPTPTPLTEDNVVLIKLGVTGAAVSSLQTRLTQLGYYDANVDGTCKADDVAAIKAFQEKNGLKVDGVAGYDTQSKMYSVTAVMYSGAIAGGTVDSYTTLRKGATGTAVVTLQTRLIELGYLTGDADGKYGIATAEAVTLFQKNNGLLRDGIAGKDTQTKLYSATAVKAESATPTPAPTSSLIMKGDSNESVRELQARLIALGYLSGSADGKFGVQTFEALKAFQRKNGLKVDGIAGTNTLTLLNSSNAISNGTTSQATATPTTSTGGSTGTVTKPTASMVQYANWYTTVKALARKYPYATVYDFSTGLSWQVHMFSLGAHADAEPLTAQDTANLEKAFGGNTWNPKAVWVIFADGSVYMASTHSMPHSPQHRTDNNFDGHLCIHFPRTMAQVTAIGPYATSHQKCIDQGWQTTQSMIK